jgi:TldD protein
MGTGLAPPEKGNAVNPALAWSSPWLWSRAPAAAAADPGPGRVERHFADGFGLGRAELERILRAALEEGGDYCDLFLQHTKGSWLVMEDGEVNRAYTAVRLGLGVRVLVGGQTGYAFSQVMDLDTLLRTARAAACLARAGGQPGGRGAEVAPLSLARGRDLYPQAQPWGGVAVDRRLELLRSLQERTAGRDPRLVRTVLQFHDGVSRIVVATGEGLLRADLRPRTTLVASCVAEEGGRRESNHQDLAARAGLEFYTAGRLEELARRAVERTVRQFRARPVAAGEMACVLAPGSAGVLLHEAIGHGLEADMNRRGVSTYAERLGEKVAGPEVTVVDDGTIAGSHGAVNFDDEGADSQRTVLVRQGVLQGFLHDRLSAAHYGAAPTGNGRRQSYEHPPLPRMRAIHLEPGPHAPEEVIGAVKRGIYAEQFTGGQVNIGAGDFSFYVKGGWAIEDGRLTHPVKDVNLVGNGPRVLERITMVGDDLAFARGGYLCGKEGQSVPVSQGLPTTLVSAIGVGGTK